MADVWEAYRDELEGMERQARTNLDSSVALVNTVAAHILNSGGKRIRPFLLLLSARLCGYTGRDHYQLASLVEFIHTASLLHDDVVDDADIRRGRPTARKVWGNQISILVGDYLYSKAFCQVVDFRNHGINDVLGEACKKMAEGEVLQLYYNGNPSMPEEEYLKIVEHKTAGLMAASCRMGAILADASDAQQDALFRFGQQSRRDLREFIDTCAAQDWDSPKEFTVVNRALRATPRKIVLHILVHEIRHWAQIATMLRLQGLPADLHDLLLSPVLDGEVRSQGTV